MQQDDDDEDDDDSHPLTNMPDASPDVVTTVTFPGLDNDDKLPIAEVIPMLIGFKNNGEKDVNVTAIMVRAVANVAVFTRSCGLLFAGIS